MKQFSVRTSKYWNYYLVCKGAQIGILAVDTPKSFNSKTKGCSCESAVKIIADNRLRLFFFDKPWSRKYGAITNVVLSLITRGPG